MTKKTIIIDQNYHITLADVSEINKGKKKIQLSDEPSFVNLINDGHDVIKKTIVNNIPIYGVNTGFGDNCVNQISHEYATELQKNLVSFHGCGVGSFFSLQESQIILLLRLISNSKGYSGVRYELLKQMEAFLNAGIFPLIPELGSVGASGDLTPLSYVAACLTGKRKVYYQGGIVETAEALKKEGLKPLTFEAKEALAILNGTSVMTAVASLAILKIKKQICLLELTTALALEALSGNKGGFSPLIQNLKPHNGQQTTAKNILEYLEDSQLCNSQAEINEAVHDNSLNDKSNVILKRTIQDKYSLRCTPQIVGMVRDTLEWSEKWITVEMNSVNDNPIIDYENGDIYKGGNFYGGHVCQAMDSLRVGIGNLADLLDKQIELLIDEKFNHGLGANLVYQKGDKHFTMHGFKAMQITSTALSVEIASMGQAISLLSRPTESLNQDKVSLGTISARHTRDSMKLLDYMIAIQLLVLSQAIELRGIGLASTTAKTVIDKIRSVSSFLEVDRELDEDINKVVNLINEGELDSVLLN